MNIDIATYLADGLATPELLPATRRVVSLISRHRYQIRRSPATRGE
jgi:hypothetical protein